MAIRAATWDDTATAGGRARLGAAFVVSLALHATLLLTVRDWRAADAAALRPLVVTLRGAGGDAPGVGGAASPAGPARAAASGAAPAARNDGAPAAERPTLPPDAVRRPPAAIASRPAPRRAVAAAPERRRDRFAFDARAESSRAATEDAAASAVRGAGAAASSDPTRTAAPEHGARGETSVATGDLVATTAGGSGDGAAGGASGTGTGRGHGTGGSGASGDGADGLRALCASCPAPDYPPRARRQGWQGTVDVALAIGADGSVVDARVGRSSGYPPLDDVALDVARRSRFTVPAHGGELRGQLRYRFVLDATAARR